jgi:hypothetical protein
MSVSGDPHEIEAVLDKAEEYQAPQREDDHKQEEKAAPGDENGGQVDVNLLEAQRRRSGHQSPETIVTDPSEAPVTVSGPDETSDEPGAVPPGESM